MKKHKVLKVTILIGVISSIVAANVMLKAQAPESPKPTKDTTAYQPPAYFDLVVYGNNLDHDDVLVLLEANIGHGNNWSRLPEASFMTEDEALFVIRHLSTKKYLGNDIRENFMKVFLRNYQDDPAAIKGIYAFPHTSQPTPHYPDILKTLIEDEPMEAKAHSLANYIRPVANNLTYDEFDVIKVEAPVRYKKPAMLEVKWLEMLYANS